jgi:hypothetical protein
LSVPGFGPARDATANACVGYRIRVPSSVMIAAVLLGQPTGAAPSAALHDPPVFRCIFEDRTRMVLLNPAPELWVAFNPATCAVQKVWSGGIRLRGKVYDFSQDNSTAAPGAAILAENTGVLLSLPDQGGAEAGAGWSLTGITPLVDREGWRVAPAGGDAVLVSPVVDTFPYERVVLAFDETGRPSPFRIDVSTDGGATWGAQSFTSTVNAHSDTDWQFTFKTIDRPAERLRLRLSLPEGASPKNLRRVRLTGDRNPWRIVIEEGLCAAVPRWKGYSRPAEASAGVGAPICTLRYDLALPDGRSVAIAHAVASPSPGVLEETIIATDLPVPSTVELDLPAAGDAKRVSRRSHEGDERWSTVPATGTVRMRSDLRGRGRLVVRTEPAAEER